MEIDPVSKAHEFSNNLMLRVCSVEMNKENKKLWLH